MTEPGWPFSRRALLLSLGAVAAAGGAEAADDTPLLIEARNAGAGRPAVSPRMSLHGTGDWKLRLGEAIRVRLSNRYSEPIALSWPGLSMASLEPVLATPPLAPNASTDLTLTPRYAGSFFCLAQGLKSQASAGFGFAVAERVAPGFDRDDILLLEPGPDGRWLTNGAPDPAELASRPGDMLRLRLINASQANAIAIKIDNVSARVIALDSHPAEPFPPRDGRLILAPGTRIDVALESPAAGQSASLTLSDGRGAQLAARIQSSGEAKGAAPRDLRLPDNGLPAQLPLRSAQRIALDLAGADWTPLSALDARGEPAFRVKQGGVAVLAISNSGPAPAMVHLHGHAFRLLDRLDDGWKPFWLDTLIVDAGQTHRVAFATSNAGRWLIESATLSPPSPRRVRSYLVA